MISVLKNLWKTLELNRKYQTIALTFLIIVCAFAELVSIAAVIPFISILVSPETILENTFISFLADSLDLKTLPELRKAVTIFFIIIIIVAALLRFTLLYFQTRLSFAIGADYARSMYFKTLHQPFLVHVNRNSSEVVSTIVLKANMLSTSALLPLLTIVSSSVILIFIVIGVLIIDPWITLIVFSSFFLSYVLLSFLTKKRLDSDSYDVNFKQDDLMRSIQEGLGGIRDIIIDNLQQTFTNDFEKSHYGFRRAAGNIHIIASSPKYAIEAVGMIIIMLIALSLINTSDNSIVTGIPILGVLALVAQKLFPILQALFASISTLRGSIDSMDAVFNLYDQKISEIGNEANLISFDNKIEFRNTSFKYVKESEPVLDNINIAFNKGDKIGIIGETGSGKSTLMDILMGLIIPTHGSLCIDNIPINASNSNSWQRFISHVPQSIFLTDSTIAENIAFGIPLKDIDIVKVKKAAERAQISETIELLDKKYFSNVGERGTKLSGGQLQRIGLARALYKESDIIILDEATSALDSNTENSVMKAINNGSKEITLFIVAHRLSTLKDCTRIIKIEDGKISYSGSYENIPN